MRETQAIAEFFHEIGSIGSIWKFFLPRFAFDYRDPLSLAGKLPSCEGRPCAAAEDYHVVVFHSVRCECIEERIQPCIVQSCWQPGAIAPTLSTWGGVALDWSVPKFGDRETAGKKAHNFMRNLTVIARISNIECELWSQTRCSDMQTLQDTLNQAEKQGVAIGHFNVSDLVQLKAVFGAAKDLNVPVIVGASEGERGFMGVAQIAALVKSLRDEFDFPVFLNADHTHTRAGAEEAARAGFDSIVFDLSALPLDENVLQTREAVAALKAINPSILIEGEIGDIGTGSEVHETISASPKRLTTPDEARQFVEQTGIDILAPAVGNMHGMSKSMVRGESKQHLDIERIAAIKTAARVPLTLHGGSGTDDEDFRRAITAGIRIIHVNTELRVAWRRSLDESLARTPEEVVPYKILPPVVESVRQVVKSRLLLFNNPASGSKS